MTITISIVSHHSGTLITPLLQDLKSLLPSQAEVLLTINCPEDESYLAGTESLPITVLRNPRPLGFGANHNQAFALSRGSRFVVVNPDIRLVEAPWAALEAALSSGVGACAPQVLSPSGLPEDSIRHYPTPGRLLRRVVLRQRRADYQDNGEQQAQAVDWAAGMFIMFDAQAFRAVGGFDTRYHMYLEDVDICRRMNTAGRQVVWQPNCKVIHDAQRASRRSWQHRRWHARSMLRFLVGV